MDTLILCAAAVLAAGYAFTGLRRRLPGGLPLLLAGVGLVGFPLATLALAQLFDSDFLGWVFGLSLMAGVVLLPCAAVFALGMAIRRWRAPRR